MSAEHDLGSSVGSYVETASSGYSLLNDPLLNKGTAFTEEERDLFELHGLLPPTVATLGEQVARRYQAMRQLPNDFERYVFLRGLQDTNEVLFYALLVRHFEELLPIVYTPTVGLGCQHFSQAFRKPRGLFLSIPHQQRIARILAHPRFDSVEAIVVTDGERILGLGDQGAGGMGISIGKLSLYTGCGGLHPATTLPIFLDVGTNNPERLSDPLYIGWRHERLRGQPYDDFIEAFVSAVTERWPHVLLQWEDFARDNATRLLERYRDRLCTFNDDIQGTAVVAAGALLAAVNVTGLPMREQRVAVVGAGGAGTGISSLLLRAMIEDGLTEVEARRRFYLIDRDGLLVEGMPDLLPFQERFIQPRDAVADWVLENESRIGLSDVVHNAKPTVLIGVSGQPGAFPENVVRAMAASVKRPVIFPLSNPTSRAEATPADLMAWTEGRAVIGTGSPFPALLKNGMYVRVDQTNNSYVFPGIGLGAIAVRARRVSDAMLMAAARALADISPARLNPNANLLPNVSDLRDVSLRVAQAVALQARNDGLTEAMDAGDMYQKIRNKMWAPLYRPYRRIN
ncbi:Malate dehydrogenase (oxaloacetate-decarboxylating) (NADP(+)) [Methylobacterium sp. 4-46]|uniref:NAD-dependent malic enzyme n=1 Tax=unclassified Methylobacterium TaxID=2615210 RepID=UPI000152C2EB|nr:MULTISPECIES: NAD-dependent malic enzyme [Methylobacterium]ACA15766.1 Malate dehydrogenase (oxaloacetate-decarboxylating) (NADP(+)) [Methylobacterium sp. 4-46]WFT81498.1 NAD-dependent malic enzyme [Methylobacterium nodulans]